MNYIFVVQLILSFGAPANLPLAYSGAHAEKRPASLQGILDVLGFESYRGKREVPCQKPMDFLGFQGWVSCRRCLVAEPVLHLGAPSLLACCVAPPGATSTTPSTPTQS